MSEARLVQKLVHVLGRVRADALIQATLAELGATDLASPDTRLRFGNALLRQGGIVEAVGRSIKIQALLEGAVEGPGPEPTVFPAPAGTPSQGGRR